MWKRTLMGNCRASSYHGIYHFCSSQFSLTKHLLNNLSSKGVPVQVYIEDSRSFHMLFIKYNNVSFCKGNILLLGLHNVKRLSLC